MRKYTLLKKFVNTDFSDGFIIKKVMIFETSNNDTYVFLYDTIEDENCCADLWFESLKNAENMCFEDYGIGLDDWIIIDDPLPFCQHDFIAPVRVKGRDIEEPQYGVFEKLVNNNWIKFD